MAVRVSGGRQKRRGEKREKTLRYGYAPRAGAAVNNETLHQRGDACGVFIA